MSRQAIRLITIAWGERYITELFSLTLPAILAPNNLPALARHFDCELVIVTEEGWFDRLREQPIYARLASYCSIELRPIDDLINRPDAYGMSLTYALFRGFEDLGSAMVERQLIFFNADFILADGSLRTVGEKILQGERLILAPSYCVVGEVVTHCLEARLDREHGHLAVLPREMAEIALRNRHNTIRGKTVNQQAFSVEWIDQFYWLIDQRTLIGHQLPIAVVSMRPERVLTDMCTFWDYGIISEACPATQRCIISDSDDFLMVELRSGDTARDQLRLGWPEPKEIAGKLKQFITSDPISLARHTLILHSGDLPAEIDDAKAKLDRFVEAVLAELPAELTHWVNHPIWAYHYPRFHAARAVHLGQTAPISASLAAVPEEPMLPASIMGWGPRAIARRLYHRWFGLAPWFRPIHPRWGDVQPVLNALNKNADAPTLVVTSSDLTSRLFSNLAARHMSVAALALPRAAAVVPAVAAPAGQPGRLRIASEQPISAELLLHGEATSHKVYLRSLDLEWETAGGTAAPAAALVELAPPPAGPRSKYGLCLLELSVTDLRLLPQMLERVLPWMRSGGRIVIFHINTGAGHVLENLIRTDSLWLDHPCRIYFVGSEMSVRALERFFAAIAALRTRRPVAVIRGLVGLGIACLSALKVSRLEGAHSRREPTPFSSLTLQIELPQGEPFKAPAIDEQRAIA